MLDTDSGKGLRRAEDSALRDNALYELGGRHVEGGIVDRALGRRRLAAAHASDLARVPLLDGNGGARGNGRVDGRERRRHIEGNAVMTSEHGHRVSPDLVGGVAVGRDAADSRY